MIADRARARARYLALVVVAVGAAAVVFFAWPRSEGSREVRAGDGEKADRAASGEAVDIPVGHLIRAADEEAEEGDEAANEAFRQRVAQAYDEYRDYSKYPPWSRPADGSQEHIYNWNVGEGYDHPVARNAEGDEIMSRIELDRMFADLGQELTAKVHVWKETAAGPEAVEFSVRGEVRVWDDADWDRARKTGKMHAAGQVKVADVAFDADPEDDTSKVARFVPSAIEALREKPQSATLFAYVSAAGQTRPLEARFNYATKPPFEILAKRSDDIRDGSLVVELDVNSRTDKPVLVQATLFDEKGQQAIAIYDDYVRLDGQGTHTVPITFFGRILRERGVDGPYSIRAIHGKVDSRGKDVFWACEKTFFTAAYAADGFSDEEWWDDERIDKMKHYEDTMNELGGTEGR